MISFMLMYSLRKKVKRNPFNISSLNVLLVYTALLKLIRYQFFHLYYII